MGRRGPQRLDAKVKADRGTLRPVRERLRRVGVSQAVSGPVAQSVAPKDYAAVAVEYARSVIDGRIVAGTWTVKAATRFLRMIERATGDDSPFTWSPAHVDHVCAFVARLPHVEGRWSSPTIILTAWQVWLLAACYGFRQRDGRRLVTTVFFEVARKSAKSTLTAAAALYHLLEEQEPGAQVTCGATTGTQARIVFSIMQRMVRKAAWLREAGLTVFANAITHDALDATAKPINAKSSTQDGLNPSFISLDESHAQSFELHDVLKSAQGARENPALWCPTTAGYDLTSVGYALRSTAMKILDGVIESDHTFVALYELDPEDDWRDAGVWVKAAPMIGITPTRDYVTRYCADAQATPGLQGEFEVKICNRWLHSASTWLAMLTWDACADPSVTLEDFKGQRCWIGGDLAERDDLAAIALLFERDELLYAFVRHYLPRDVVEDRSRKVPEYRSWVNADILRMTEGNMTDFAVIERDLRADCDTFAVEAISLERYGAMQMAGNLSADGLPCTIESKSARTFTEPARELEARVKARRFRHDGNSCLRWQASNCAIDRRVDGSLLPKKETAESPNKIDAIDAVLLALNAWLRHAAAITPSIYDRPDFTPELVMF